MPDLYIPIRIIFADDHELMHQGLSSVIKKEKNIEIVGDANNGQHLINLTRQLQPDIVITDIQMPVMDGIEATKEIAKTFPHIGIIAFSMFAEEDVVFQMLRAGAKGYILKNSHNNEIIEAIKLVNKGETFFCRQTSKIISDMRIKSGNRFSAKRIEFTNKEITIIKLICEDLSNSEIAAQVELSERTVEGYRLRIMNKMDAKNSAGIVIYAIKYKIFEFRHGSSMVEEIAEDSHGKIF